MSLLLTILTVLAVWALLGVLIMGLLMIMKVLEGVRDYLRKIATGVRAIEQETRPLQTRTEALVASMNEAAEATGRAAGGLEETNHAFEAAAPAFRPGA